MDQHEKSELLVALMAIHTELQKSNEAREKQQNVHIHIKPRVSLDTVVLSLASGLIAAATIYACVPK